MSTCDHCGQPARLQIREVECLHLCEGCADRWGRRTLGIPLGRWLRLFVGEPNLFDRCPLCGCSREEIQQTGFYGCAFCYEIFLQGTV